MIKRIKPVYMLRLVYRHSRVSVRAPPTLLQLINMTCSVMTTTPVIKVGPLLGQTEFSGDITRSSNIKIQVVIHPSVLLYTFAKQALFWRYWKLYISYYLNHVFKFKPSHFYIHKNDHGELVWQAFYAEVCFSKTLYSTAKRIFKIDHPTFRNWLIKNS